MYSSLRSDRTMLTPFGRTRYYLLVAINHFSSTSGKTANIAQVASQSMVTKLLANNAKTFDHPYGQTIDCAAITCTTCAMPRRTAEVKTMTTTKGSKMYNQRLQPLKTQPSKNDVDNCNCKSTCSWVVCLTVGALVGACLGGIGHIVLTAIGH